MASNNNVSLFAPDYDLIRKVRLEKDATIANLAKVAGLDPENDFNFADMEGTDWRGSDSSKFSLKGAALGGTKGITSVQISGVGLKIGESMIYPLRGIGKIVDIEAGNTIDSVDYLVQFERDGYQLRINSKDGYKQGMHHFFRGGLIDRVNLNLRHSKRAVFSRDEEIYNLTDKLNSGNIALISEVIRDTSYKKRRLLGFIFRDEHEIHLEAWSRLADAFCKFLFTSRSNAIELLQGIRGIKKSPSMDEIF